MFTKTKLAVAIAFVCVVATLSASAMAGRRISETKTFDVKRGGTLIVEARNVGADIGVRVWNQNKVEVTVDGIPEEDLGDLEITESSNTVRVEYYGNRGWRSAHVRIEANVPQEFNLDLDTSGGDIEVANKISGTVSANTSGGDIQLDAVDGEIDLHTSGGDIVVRDVLGDAELRTSGGDIELGNIKGKVQAHTSGGDITVGNVEKDLDAKTAGGDIEVGNVGGYADVSTAGGDVRLGQVSGTADVRTAGGDIELLSASGRVTARTAGGDIVLEKISGSIQAETAGGDVVAELMPSGNRDSELKTAGGDIELFVPDNAKISIMAEIHLRGSWGNRDDDYDVHSEFQAKSHDRNDRNVTAEYVLNGGGSRISLETTNGDISIRKLRK